MSIRDAVRHELEKQCKRPLCCVNCFRQSPSQSRMLIELITVLTSIANPYYENDHAHFQIEFVVESNAAYVNHPFQAKLLLIQQSAQPRNILYMVNGDTLSAEKGGGILKNTFKNPDLNTLECEVQVINPLTKDIKTCRRNVSLMVSPEPN